MWRTRPGVSATQVAGRKARPRPSRDLALPGEPGGGLGHTLVPKGHLGKSATPKPEAPACQTRTGEGRTLASDGYDEPVEPVGYAGRTDERALYRGS